MRGLGLTELEGLGELHDHAACSGERVLPLLASELTLAVIGAGWPLATLPPQSRKSEPLRLGAIDPLLTVGKTETLGRLTAFFIGAPVFFHTSNQAIWQGTHVDPTAALERSPSRGARSASTSNHKTSPMFPPLNILLPPPVHERFHTVPCPWNWPAL